jgi:hypothetical protein
MSISPSRRAFSRSGDNPGIWRSFNSFNLFCASIANGSWNFTSDATTLAQYAARSSASLTGCAQTPRSNERSTNWLIKITKNAARHFVIVRFIVASTNRNGSSAISPLCQIKLVTGFALLALVALAGRSAADDTYVRAAYCSVVMKGMVESTQPTHKRVSGCQ